MEPMEIVEVLKRTDPFEILEETVLAQVARKMVVRTYVPGTYVFRQGDSSLDCLFIVASGLAEITVTNDRGVETVVNLRKAYDFFGETVVLSQQRYPGSARVKETLTCLLLDRRSFENLIYHHTDLSSFFNAILAERMRLLYEGIVAEHSYDSYSCAESPLFRKRVSEIMSYPVICCFPENSITDAANLMMEKDISAIVVMDRNRRIRGILTENNLVRYIIAERRFDLNSCRVEQIVNSKVVSIPSDAYIGQALVSMIRNKTKHLIVLERGDLVGMVTMVDLIKSRSTGQLLLSHNIENQLSIPGLSLIGREVDNILHTLVAERASVTEILDVMSELHERMTQRIIELSEERMRREGLGGPPVDYCWINMGSAARYEQTLRTDQDNAIIYMDPEPEKALETSRYFTLLAEYIVEGLAECGFSKCTGGVMASTPKWRRSLNDWMHTVDEWAHSMNSEDTRNLTILLDYRPVWGNFTLAERLWDRIFESFRKSLSAGHRLARDDRNFRIPVSFLGTFITEKSGPHKDEMNLKTAGIVHIVNGIRIMALHHAIREPSTFGRLERLEQDGFLGKDDTELFRASFEALMMLKIQENLKKVSQGKVPDNYIDPYSLRKRERMMLKDALSGVSQLQKMISKQFHVPWLEYFSS